MLGTKNLTAHDCQSFIARHFCSVRLALAVIIVWQITDLVLGCPISIGEDLEQFSSHSFVLFHHMLYTDRYS